MNNATNAPGENPPLIRYVIASFGAICGATLYTIKAYGTGPLGVEFIPALPLAICIFMVVGALSIQAHTWKKDALFAISLGLFSLIFFYAAYLYAPYPADEGHSIARPSLFGFNRANSFIHFLGFGVTFVLLIVIPLVFYQTARDQSRLRFPYHQLFLHAWTNKLVFFVAVFFYGISCLILTLWAGLFKLIGIDFFSELFTNSWFVYIFSGMALGLGISIARERPRIIQSLLNIVLLLSRVLAPVLGSVLLLFLAFVPFVGFHDVLNTRHLIPLMTTTLFIFLLLENAVIQGSTSEGGFSKNINRLVMATNIALPLLAIFSAYALYLRIDQYGLTPNRIYLGIIIFISLAYSLSYCISTLVLKQGWIEGAYKANPLIAVFTLVCALAIHFPPFEPLALSAKNQIDRLRAGKIAPIDFDFSYLKLKLGPVGRSAFKEIAADDVLMGNPIIASRMKYTEQLRSYRPRGNRKARPSVQYDNQTLENISEYMMMVPNGMTAPDSIVADWTKTYRQQLIICKKKSDTSSKSCWIIKTDINKDGQPDILWFTGDIILTKLKTKGETWADGPSLKLAQGFMNQDKAEKLLDTLHSSGFKIVPNETDNITIGEYRFK